MIRIHTNKNLIIDKVIEKIQISGKLRDFDWILEKAKKGFFVGINENNAEYVVNQLQSMAKILDALHGENWDFSLIGEENYNDDYDFLDREKFILGIIIHYPTINITNSKEEKHLIKDLFVYLSLSTSYGGLIISGVKGCRSTLEYLEYSLGYMHSHLPSFRSTSSLEAFSLQDFCLGSNEVSDLRLILRDNYSEELFELFLLSLNEMLKWESLEGGPHIKMAQLVSGRIYPEITERDMENLYHIILNQGTIRYDDFNYLIEDNKYIICKDKKYKDFLHSYIKLYCSGSLKRLYVKIVNGIIYNYGETEQTPQEDLDKIYKGIYTLIRGKKIKFDIKALEIAEDLNAKEYEVEPKFINYVADKLQQKFNHKIIRGNAIKLQSTNSNA